MASTIPQENPVEVPSEASIAYLKEKIKARGIPNLPTSLSAVS